MPLRGTNDLWFALRTLGRKHGFTGLAVLILALGIGANTAVFALFDALFLRGAPLPNPVRMIWLFSATHGEPYGPSSYPDYLDFKHQNQTAEDLAAEGPLPCSISDGSHARQIWRLLVTDNYFSMLGADAALGRFFTPRDLEQNAGEPPIVLGTRYWQTQLAADPGVIGRTVLLNGTYHVVIGIASEKLRSLGSIFSPDAWLPLSSWAARHANAEQLRRDSRWLQIIGRLKPGVSLAEAQAGCSGSCTTWCGSACVSSRSGPLSAQGGGRSPHWFCFRDFV